MPLTLDRYDVWLPRPDDELTADLPPDFTVLVRTGDQLRAELESKRMNLPPQMREVPLNMTALFIWAAMARCGHTELPAAAFLADPPEYQPAGAGEVDPTKRQPGDSA